ncbi:MAG: S46 family peptidase [Cyclobacteriaceae bacterium]|nr:S46 family peptidase [Cyclobacteriaceae bacterium]MCH8516491.1 S46 family peptidase [Cyclobacteriaceae bacterium]
MKKYFLILISVLLIQLPLQANEGMWLPILLKDMNEKEMQAMGMRISAEDIYSVNNSSMKDAIVSLGGFCTAEIISKKGLLLTNHHCAYGQIQSHSSVENDYLKDGFWAASHADEIPNPGLFVRFLVRMEDVTDEVLEAVEAGMSTQERQQAIRAAMQKVEAEAVDGTNYTADVKPFFDGNEYYLMVYETYRDIRLVGAPPESIGKFGGDTDNWMYPRHTGDFALLRIYSAPDGSPAEYSEDNIPFVPKHSLPVSLKGVKEGDFSMVMGFPGSTDRYLSSYGIDLALEQTNPTRVNIREKRLALLKEDMDADRAVRIKYASKYASVANYWKYFIGQSRGLKNLNVPDQKVAIENEFRAWYEQDAARKEIYGEALNMIKEGYQELKPYNEFYLYLLEAAFGVEILSFSNSFQGLTQVLGAENPNEERIASMVESLRDRTKSHFKDYNRSTDAKVFAGLLKMFAHDVKEEQLPASLKEAKAKYGDDFSLWAQEVYDASIFSSKAAVMAFLDNPTAETLKNDPALLLVSDILNTYRSNIAPQIGMARAKIDEGNRLFVKGLREMNPDKKFYPNANSTLRVSYGQVKSYVPEDGVKYKTHTTARGIIEKENPNDFEFIVPERLMKLIEAGDFGDYADENGDLVINFISVNDITGGNSGSPVINGDGHLIGTAFDGNWEAMSGDIAFANEVQRCISVDIRYTLFIIDKFANARHLIEEMEVIR